MKKGYSSSKTYTHAQGLSCTFRQHKAKSHCAQLHGYALQVKLEFDADFLDERNWVVDFGSLKEVKHYLEVNFDHVTIVAADDPCFELFQQMQVVGVANIRVVEHVGCEAFADEIFDWVSAWLYSRQSAEIIAKGGVVPLEHRVRLAAVIVSEHEGNSATVYAAGR